MKNRTLYEILEVSEDSSSDFIKAAYRILASKYHPDKVDNKAKSNSKSMSDINEAYRILSDHILKSEYDRELSKERKTNKKYNGNQKNNHSNYYGVFKENQEEIAKWEIVEEYHPQIKKISNNLYKISEDLFLEYAKIVLSGKEYNQIQSIAEHMEIDFLKNNFGLNPRAQHFGKKLLLSNQTLAAKKFRLTIKTVDDKVKVSKIENKICQEFNINTFYKYYIDELKLLNKNDPIIKESTGENNGFNILGFIISAIFIFLFFYFLKN